MENPTATAVPPEPEIVVSNVVVEETLVPFRATVISTETESISEQFARCMIEGTKLAARIMSIVQLGVRTQEDYDDAAAELKLARAYLQTTGDLCEPVRNITYSLYNRVLSTKKMLQMPVEEQLKPLTNAILTFEREQEELRQREERRLAEEQRKAEENRKLESAAAAEAAGMDEQSVNEILEAPSTTPTPAASPTFQRAASVSRREAWCAEVTDLWALVKAAAKDKRLLPLLEANMPALNAQARSLKQALAIPGVRAVDKGSVAVRGART
jgi:hypothetical protein